MENGSTKLVFFGKLLQTSKNEVYYYTTASVSVPAVSPMQGSPWMIPEGKSNCMLFSSSLKREKDLKKLSHAEPCTSLATISYT